MWKELTIFNGEKKIFFLLYDIYTHQLSVYVKQQLFSSIKQIAVNTFLTFPLVGFLNNITIDWLPRLGEDGVI